MKGKYGEWTVLGPSPVKRYYSRCQCSCGAIKDVNNSTLRLGKSTSCGHDKGKKLRENKYKESDDKIINKRFGKLIALKRVSYKGESVYLCRCDCGNMVEVPAVRLLSGSTTSCRCLRKNNSAKHMSKIMELGHEEIKKGHVEGTSLCHLEQDISKNNTTGVKGVSKMKNGKYRAYINLKRKQKYLGTFESLEEASEARMEAEEKYFRPILDKYAKD